MEYKVHFEPGIARIGQENWDALVGYGNPFARYAFLAALESTGCVGGRSGWTPYHTVVTDSMGHLCALMPGYLKAHSYGEYVFDFAWAEAYQHNGIDYYPKWITAIPFTPSVGPRIIIAEGLDIVERQALMGEMLSAVTSECKRMGISSWHLLFPDADSANLVNSSSANAGSVELSIRIGCQYHWRNQPIQNQSSKESPIPREGYQSFDDFLQTLTSRKRKNIRKERRRVVEAGITFQELNEAEITDGDMHSFYGFYQRTYLRRGQHPYLTEQFFQQLLQSMPEQLCLLFAMQQGKVIASALFLKNEVRLFGRYWGALDNANGKIINFLHFETCYYQGIELCIRHRLQTFDAGAQGEHKLLRGFEPIETSSYHWIKHPGFRQAVKQFVLQEADNMGRYIEDAKNYLPFKIIE